MVIGDTAPNSALNDFCRFRFAMIHIALMHCYKLESFLNIIFAVFLQTAISASRYCNHASLLVNWIHCSLVVPCLNSKFFVIIFLFFCYHNNALVWQIYSTILVKWADPKCLQFVSLSFVTYFWKVTILIAIAIRANCGRSFHETIRFADQKVPYLVLIAYMYLGLS